MKKILILALSGAVILGSGCSTLPSSDLASLQGTWEGKEIGGKLSNCQIVVTGNTAEFRSSDTNEWLKANFSLREQTNPRQIVFVTTDCAYPPHIGITRYGIYRFEKNLVRLTANEPGVVHSPAVFDEPGARQFELRKK